MMNLEHNYSRVSKDSQKYSVSIYSKLICDGWYHYESLQAKTMKEALNIARGRSIFAKNQIFKSTNTDVCFVEMVITHNKTYNQKSFWFLFESKND